MKPLSWGSWFHLSFEHFDVISMVDKSTDHGKLLSIVFYNNIDIFLSSVSVDFSRKIACGKERKTICATITSFPWSVLISTIALDQSRGKKLLRYCEKYIFATNYFIALV